MIQPLAGISLYPVSIREGQPHVHEWLQQIVPVQQVDRDQLEQYVCRKIEKYFNRLLKEIKKELERSEEGAGPSALTYSLGFVVCDHVSPLKNLFHEILHHTFALNYSVLKTFRALPAGGFKGNSGEQTPSLAFLPPRFPQQLKYETIEYWQLRIQVTDPSRIREAFTLNPYVKELSPNFDRSSLNSSISSLAKALFQRVEDAAEECDLTIRCEDGEIRAHRNVLMNSSAALFFRERISDPKVKTVELPVKIQKQLALSYIKLLYLENTSHLATHSIEELIALFHLCRQTRAYALGEDCLAAMELRSLRGLANLDEICAHLRSVSKDSHSSLHETLSRCLLICIAEQQPSFAQFQSLVALSCETGRREVLIGCLLLAEQQKRFRPYLMSGALIRHWPILRRAACRNGFRKVTRYLDEFRPLSPQTQKVYEEEGDRFTNDLAWRMEMEKLVQEEYTEPLVAELRRSLRPVVEEGLRKELHDQVYSELRTELKINYCERILQDIYDALLLEKEQELREEINEEYEREMRAKMESPKKRESDDEWSSDFEFIDNISEES